VCVCVGTVSTVGDPYTPSGAWPGSRQFGLSRAHQSAAAVSLVFIFQKWLYSLGNDTILKSNRFDIACFNTHASEIVAEDRVVPLTHTTRRMTIGLVCHLRA